MAKANLDRSVSCLAIVGKAWSLRLREPHGTLPSRVLFRVEEVHLNALKFNAAAQLQYKLCRLYA